MHPEKRLSNVERLVGYALVLGAAALGVALVAVAMSLTGCGNIVIDLTPDWSDVVDTVPDLPEPDDASTPHDDGGSLDTLDVASEDTTTAVGYRSEWNWQVRGGPCEVVE